MTESPESLRAVHELEVSLDMLLAQLRATMAAAGRVLASMPTGRHFSMVRGLGRDATHLIGEFDALDQTLTKHLEQNRGTYDKATEAVAAERNVVTPEMTAAYSDMGH